MTQKSEPNFDYSKIPLGYYDKITNKKKGIQSFWHFHKFNRIIESINNYKYNSILDIGCFSGTFLGMVPESKFKEQVGTDIIKDQVNYANQVYGKPFRKFVYLQDIKAFDTMPNDYFDYITIIEVIEHLKKEEICKLINAAHEKLKVGGKLIITTPNYLSAWPLLEIILNIISKVDYEEQHFTHFNYFNLFNKLTTIVNDMTHKFKPDYITTTHLFTPYIAFFSFNLANQIASVVSHQKWKIPFGSLLLAQFEKLK